MCTHRKKYSQYTALDTICGFRHSLGVLDKMCLLVLGSINIIYIKKFELLLQISALKSK